jgi:hypothetical protein
MVGLERGECFKSLCTLLQGKLRKLQHYLLESLLLRTMNDCEGSSQKCPDYFEVLGAGASTLSQACTRKSPCSLDLEQTLVKRIYHLQYICIFTSFFYQKFLSLVAPEQSSLCFFLLHKKAHVFERACTLYY